MMQTRLAILLSILGILFFLAVLPSCKKKSFLTEGGELAFSTDTLKFDTVFTSIGSVTRSFKIYNTNKQKIKIDRVALRKGNASPYRLNVDGVSTRDLQDVEIAAEDSIFVFVAITINPTTGLMPFIVDDVVDVTLNGEPYEVQLEAYGQDAHYIRDSVLQSNTWINDKPYVIINSALVDSLQVLTIQKGCRIYMHQNSKLFVKGTLNVFGTKKDSVIFQGDRLDRDYFGYKDFPGEWRGLHFLAANQKSSLNYAVIKNAGFTDAAIYVQPQYFLDINHPSVELNHCIVANSAGYGILGFNAYIVARNSLIHSCGLQNLALIEGGVYKFEFCTFATYGSTGINHANQPTAVLLNYRDTSLTSFTGNPLNVNLDNCIFYGPLEDEIIFGKKGSWDYNVIVKNCLFKRTTAIPTYVTATNTLLNKDPLFTDYGKWNYRPKAISPTKEAGFSIPGIIDDLDGELRGTLPSIGCYEVK